METLLSYLAFAGVLAYSVVRHVRNVKRKENQAAAALEQGKDDPRTPMAQHPHIDLDRCIGCGTCTEVCPEGHVLGLIGGKAALVAPHKCIGHGICADQCPVGAIEIVMGEPSVMGDRPHRTPDLETNIGNLFIIGELGGLALIKNAVNEGRDCVDTIAAGLAATGSGRYEADVRDVCIVGAGPGGISASLRAIEKGLSYVTLEQDEFGGSVAKYPRQKLVMTSPVQFPMYGKFKKLEVTKEELLRTWNEIGQRADLEVHAHEKVCDIKKGPDGVFTIETNKASYRSRSVVLALGRRGEPRKLGIKGEQLPKVMYSLIDAAAYSNQEILVVGGGDSAVEAAMGLAAQAGNKVTLSYRKDAFSRIKDRNAKRIEECLRRGTVQVIFRSSPVEIRETSVRLDVSGSVREIRNDFVWIFAGGVPPSAFLEKVGIAIGRRDVTGEAHEQARRSVPERGGGARKPAPGGGACGIAAP